MSSSNAPVVTPSLKRRRHQKQRTPLDQVAPTTVGIDAAVRLIREAASYDAASVFGALLRLHVERRDSGPFASGVLGRIGEFGEDKHLLRDRLEKANVDFATVFGFSLFTLVPGDGGASSPSQGLQAGDLGDAVTMTASLLGLCRRPAIVDPSALTAVLDDHSRTWADIACATTQSGQGHHLVVRTATIGERTLADFASLIAARGATVVFRSNPCALKLTILRAELHGGTRPSVVVIDGSALVHEPDATAGEDEDLMSERPPKTDGRLALTPGAAAILPWLPGLRNTYVWRVPEAGTLPRALAGLIGGRIGPIGFHRPWCLAAVVLDAPEFGEDSARALLAGVEDPRDGGALVAMARVASTIVTVPHATSTSPRVAACRFVAASFGAPLGPDLVSLTSAQFDDRLIACDPDGVALLGRAAALAGGCRVLGFGLPGGGKSTWALALAARIAAVTGGPVITVQPAELLARSWGATERLVSAFWARARREGAILVADEFESMCAVREDDAPASGNAYLIRTLTNEWLRQLDAYPDVPLIATVNDARALDAAVRRRFQVVVHIRDELSPDQERVAWASIIGLTPPRGWTPCGAAVADVAAAAAKCRLLGRADAKAHAAAVVDARNARRGLGTAHPRRPRGRPLH